ncbi:MAG: type II secretion system secretin GspD [Sphingomonadales bacterium]|nr:type II secretion system secretin GspD [Sphingomonadales bacterium]NCO49900.1 type II secretion system secretin GspD [Sphingomonadales bacterium]NCP00947.1 type II secretion system secretin GspD [Sphingomonadales bacterium]NCP27995.1 type II secretion system secretin GspD [Sphingomonadales bacterium]NCP42927.1 type II secretion system secretin GspD [Sphingomonadales bacterium]
MSSLFARIIAVLALSASLYAAPASAQHTLNVRDADIRAFVQDAAKVTGRTFILDSRVQGKVSVVTDRPLSRSEYFEIFLSTLRANNLVAIPTTRGAYRIQPADGAASQPTRIGSRGAEGNQLVTEVVRLKSIVATEALETLRPLVSKQGSITSNRNANSLVIVDYADNIRRIRSLVGEIDRDSAASTIITLKNAGAREIATSLQALAAQGGGEGLRSPVTVVPIDSSNSIALRGDPGAVSRFAQMARELDKGAESGTEIRVHRLDYANAEQLLPVIENLLGNKGTGGSSAAVVPASGGEGAAAPAASSGGNGNGIASRGPSIVTRLEGTNAIIVAANPDVQRMIGELIRQLDTRQEQVVVEAIIVEISETLARELGVQWLVGGKDVPFAVTNFSNASPNIVDVAGGLLANQFDTTTTTTTNTATTTTTNSAVGDALRQNAADAVLSARGGFGGFATSLGGSAVLGAIINAVQSDSNSNVLSTPSLTVNNNLKGSILFGQEIPVSTGEALSNNFDNAFRTIQRQNVGIELEVTPQINAGDEVRMELRQQVSSIAGPVSDDFNELIINKREINTTVTVGDGEIIALGGLLDDNERRTIQKVPFLGDIPILGELFKSRGKSRVKTNLMVFIRPTILKDPNDARRFSSNRYGYVRDQQLRRNPDQEPSIDALVRDYLGTVPPSVEGRPDDQIIYAPGDMPAVRDSGVIEQTPLPASEPSGNQ